MDILQYYYTSFINKETGSAGFQVKAMSRDIRPETQNMIARLMAYRIPPALNEREIHTHPVALRYYYVNAQECLLICSQSNGSDPNGRPGNFFAHVLVADPSLFTSVPPIFYWNSDFWLKEDRGTRFDLGTLPEIPGDPALDFDEMWDFIQRDDHPDKLFQLMCAVIDGSRSRRRIIIIDSDKNVALWVAAISCMLPPAYRPLLTFTTYHHDPYQSQFFITGTPIEAQFRLTPSDYESYFVLNMHENKTSELEKSLVEQTLYARLVRQWATPDKYDARMLAFFSQFASRFPLPTAIDEQLNLIVLYATIMREAGSVALTDDERHAVDLVLNTFEKLKNYTDEDIKQLRRLSNFLGKRYEAANDIETHKLQQRITKLLSAHQVSTEDFLQEQVVIQTSKLFIDDAYNTWKYAVDHIAQLCQEYGVDMFVNQVNLPDALNTLTNRVMRAKPEHLIRLWRYIGPYLLPEPPSLPLFAESIRVWEDNMPTREMRHELFNAIHHAIRERDRGWLQLLVSGIEHQSVAIEPKYLKRFYRTLMLRISNPEQRERYRELVRPLWADIVRSECLDDLSAANRESILSVLLKWIVYVRRTQSYDPAQLVAYGLPKLREKCSNAQEWREMALQCLIEDELVPLLGEWEPHLVQAAFTDVALEQFVPEYVPLYERYYNHPNLPPQSRVVIAAMLAMHHRYLNAQLVSNLYTYVSSLSSPEKYYAEIASFCTPFFAAPLSDENQFHLISALFVRKHEERFWIVYWEKVCAQPPHVLGQLMAFWFSLQPLTLPQPYVTQRFFLTLQKSLEDFQQLPDFSKILPMLEEQFWYKAVQESNLVRKNAFLAKSQDLMKQVQQRVTNQKVDEELQQEQRQFDIDMKKLFVSGKMGETHLNTLFSLYNKRRPEQFWEAYKDNLIQLLLAGNVQPIIDLFSFWFDKSSFEVLGQGPYIAQIFLIGLPQVFKQARAKNEANFSKMSQRMHAYYTQFQSPDWYFLIEPLILETKETEQKFLWFKR